MFHSLPCTSFNPRIVRLGISIVSIFQRDRALIYSISKEVKPFLTIDFGNIFLLSLVVGTMLQIGIAPLVNLFSVLSNSTPRRRREGSKCVISHRENLRLAQTYSLWGMWESSIIGSDETLRLTFHVKFMVEWRRGKDL